MRFSVTGETRSDLIAVNQGFQQKAPGGVMTVSELLSFTLQQLSVKTYIQFLFPSQHFKPMHILYTDFFKMSRVFFKKFNTK